MLFKHGVHGPPPEPTDLFTVFRTGDVPKGGDITLSQRSRGQKGGHAFEHGIRSQPQNLWTR